MRDGESLSARGAILATGLNPLAGIAFDPPLPAPKAEARLFPEAEFLAADWHDWNADPFARGTWVAGIVGAAAAHAYPTWRRDGALAFASSDISPEHAGWFEAAAISGEAAAAEIQAVLAASASSQ